MDTYRQHGGFTLVEMIIVVAIIALLATMIIGGAAMLNKQSKEQTLESLFAQVETALDVYYDYRGVFPDPVVSPGSTDPRKERSELLYDQLWRIPGGAEVLDRIDDSLIADKYSGATAIGPEIYDPWGTVLGYSYTAGQQYPTLISAGPDKQFGTADDIRSK